MDEHEADAAGGPSSGKDAGAERDRGPVREYTWEGRPGEDFGPIAPPPPGKTRQEPAPPERQHVAPELIEREQTSAREPAVARDLDSARDLEPVTDRVPVLTGARDAEPARTERQPEGRRPWGAEGSGGSSTLTPVRRRRWRPIVTVLGVLIVVGGLVAAMLTVISRQALETGAPETGTGTSAEATPSSQVVVASPAAVASPPPSPAVAPEAGGMPGPPRTASPTPLALAPPTSSPAPARSPIPTSRPSAPSTPAIVPTPPQIFVTPPGLRFATSTPARLGTPSPTRTPPAVPTARPISFLSRVWSDQMLHRVGDDALICGAAASGANAQVTVIAPDRSTRVLGEFQPPSERVCYSMRLDTPGLYVLSLIVKDAGGTEIDRQSGAMSAGP